MNFMNRMPLGRLTRTAWASASLILLTSCASTPPPVEELAVGRAAVDRASSSAASEAPVEMSVARDKIARANAAYAAKDYDKARQLAAEADADAALAEAQSRSVRSSRALAEVNDGLRMLRDEMSRK